MSLLGTLLWIDVDLDNVSSTQITYALVIATVMMVFLSKCFGIGSGSDSAMESARKHRQLDEQGKESTKKSYKARYFSKQELLAYNGTDGKPIFIAIKGEIYDVSAKSGFYGPGGGYHLFAGRDATRALAKMSFEPEDLENDDFSDLAFMEKETLEDWVTKFKVYNAYPVAGRVLKEQDMEATEVEKHNGENGGSILVILNGAIYDVTIHGESEFGENGDKKAFAGKDITRAAAEGKFDEETLKNSSVEDLTKEQKDALSEYEKEFSEKHALVGKVVA